MARKQKEMEFCLWFRNMGFQSKQEFLSFLWTMNFNPNQILFSLITNAAFSSQLLACTDWGNKRESRVCDSKTQISTKSYHSLEIWISIVTKFLLHLHRHQLAIGVDWGNKEVSHVCDSDSGNIDFYQEFFAHLGQDDGTSLWCKKLLLLHKVHYEDHELLHIMLESHGTNRSNASVWLQIKYINCKNLREKDLSSPNSSKSS